MKENRLQKQGPIFTKKKINSDVILIVEDDVGLGEFLRDVLTDDAGYQVKWVTNSMDVFDNVKNVEPNLFLFDYHLPYKDGLELYKDLHALEKFKEVPIIIMSAGLPYPLEVELDELHICYLSKPFELDGLLKIVEKTLDQGKSGSAPLTGD